MKRSSLRRVSKKTSSRSKRLRLYEKAKIEYLSRFVVCESEFCNNNSSQIHHKKGRIGSLLWDKNFFLAVCPFCHTKIETNRKWAMEKGYLLDRVASSNYE